MAQITILTGAGISAESGIKTFRDAGGLWEGYDIMEVASPEGWKKNPELVTDFYNQRRMQLANVVPNAGHIALKTLETGFQVYVITQNVDDLHERAGSSNIIHLHGELIKMRSSIYHNDIYDIGYRASEYGERCAKGTILRPYIVWFGEDVPLINKAIELVSQSDILIIAGTSLEVYPAAGLLDYTSSNCKIYLIDPNRHQNQRNSKVELIRETAAVALPELVKILLKSIE